MASYQAIKNGNFSDTTVWETGVVPVGGDTAHANGNTVTIDQNVEANLRNDMIVTDHYLTGSALPNVFTSNSMSGYTISDSTASVDAYLAFNKRQSTFIGGSAGFIKIQLPSGQIFKSCLVHMSASGNYGTVTISGSLDDVSYTSLGSYGYNFLGNIVNLTNSTAYTYYRISWSGAATPTFTNIEYSTNTGALAGYKLTTNIVAGGYYNMTSAYDLTGDISYIVQDNSTILYVGVSTGVVNIGTINNPINITCIAYTTTATLSGGVRQTGNCTLNIFGTVTANQSSNSRLNHAILQTAGILNIIGTLYSGLIYGGENHAVYTTSVFNFTGIAYNTAGSSAINNVGSNTVTIVGDLYPTSTATAVVVNSAGGTVTKVGEFKQLGVAALGTCILNASNGTINVIGDCNGSHAGAPSTSYLIVNSAGGNVYITGNVTMFDVSLSATYGLIRNLSTGYIKVTGNVTGGSVANTINISNEGTRSSTNTAKIEVTGYVWGGTHSTMSPAIYSVTNTEVDIAGECKALAFPALISTHYLSINRIRGSVIASSNSVMAYVAMSVLCSSESQILRLQDTNNNTRDLTSGGSSSNYPSVNKVRKDVIFNTNQVGTNAIPLKNSVLAGVPVDDSIGIGNLLIDPQAVWDCLVSGMIPNTIGKKVTYGVNVATLAKIIESLK